MTRKQTEFLGIAPAWVLTINGPNVDYYDIEYLLDLIKDIRDWQKPILDNCYNGAEILRGLADLFGIDTGKHETYEDTLEAVAEEIEKEKRHISIRDALIRKRKKAHESDALKGDGLAYGQTGSDHS